MALVRTYSNNCIVFTYVKMGKGIQKRVKGGKKNDIEGNYQIGSHCE